MKVNRRTWLSSLALVALAAAHPAAAQDAVPAGFTSVFDGKTLNGWMGDTNFWTVRDGAITGGSDKAVPHNTYLVLEQPYAHFELHYKYRFRQESGNSGIQFRSGMTPGNYIMAGMQANVTPIGKSADRFAMLYDELGDRQEMVLLGQRAEVTRVQADGGGTGRILRTVTETVNPQQDILKTVHPAGDGWNEGVLIVHGNRYVHVVNNHMAFDATDTDPLSPKDGLIGLQLHKSSGAASYVQFKDMYIKPLTSFPDISGRFITKPAPAAEPRRSYKDSVRVNTAHQPMPD